MLYESSTPKNLVCDYNFSKTNHIKTQNHPRKYFLEVVLLSYYYK